MIIHNFLRIYCNIRGVPNPPLFTVRAATVVAAIVFASFWLRERVRRGPEPQLAALGAQCLDEAGPCLTQVPCSLGIAAAEQCKRLFLFIG